jgi:hypothetical protein
MWAHDQICITLWQLQSWFCGATSLTRGRVCFFIYAVGPRQRSLSRVRVPWDSWSYFTVSDLRLPFSSPPTTRRATQSQSYIMTDGQSASLSWCQAPIWGLRPDFYYCRTVAGLLMWGALSDEKTGLSFTISAGPRQRSHSWVQVPRHSWPYILLSRLRLLERAQSVTTWFSN